MRLYVYRHTLTEWPHWEPLEWAADRSARLAGSPTLDPDPFMYMGRLVSRDGEPDLHLYKHYHTRCYLNVDDAHRVFVFMFGSDFGTPILEADVYYRRLCGLAQAIELLDLDFYAEVQRTLDDGVGSLDNVVPIRAIRSSPRREPTRPPA